MWDILKAALVTNLLYSETGGAQQVAGHIKPYPIKIRQNGFPCLPMEKCAERRTVHPYMPGNVIYGDTALEIADNENFYIFPSLFRIGLAFFPTRRILPVAFSDDDQHPQQ